jgi:hypothetical protein
VDVKTTNGLLAVGAVGSFVGTTLLHWEAVDLFFARLGVSAWRAGGVGPLAGLLALGLLACAAAALFAESVPLRVPPEATLGVAGLLALLAFVTVVGGHPGAGALVTVVSAGVAAWAAFTLRTSAGAPRAAGHHRTARPAAPPATGRFCPGCGAKLAEGAAFCGQCGAKLGRN